MGVTPASLAHRARGAVGVPPPDSPPIAATADQLADIADRLYDRIEDDATLRPKFGSDLAGERVKLGALFVEVFLGEPRWNADFAHQSLLASHRIIHITKHDAAAWLGHARRAANDVVGADAATAIVHRLRPVAEAFVNEPEPAPDGSRREARFQPTRDALAACAKGDLARVRALLDERPSLVSPTDPGSADLLFAAVARGRRDVARELIDRGIDVNRPAPTGILFVTALCEARRRRRTALVEVLRGAGAIDDVFGAAFLGDVPALEAALDDDPSLVAEPDPASDFARTTVLDHAALGADPAGTVPILADRGAPPPLHGGALLRHAAEAGETGVVRRLLDLGADATHVTPGRWVLQPECAPLLLAAGADVNHAPTRWQSWIWISCTGNHGNRDDPDLVRALLAAGADVHARAFGKTALHFAAKAGFLGAAEVLLAAGAEPTALDDDGLTPLDHVGRSGPRADRAAMTRLLTSR